MGRGNVATRYDITHTRVLFRVHWLCSRDERHAFTKPLLLATYGVIYWRDICRRVVIETTHLRGAKWPLPALPESGAINFASPLARPASNLTGWSSLLSLARGNRRAGRLTVARFWSTRGDPGDLENKFHLPSNLEVGISFSIFRSFAKVNRRYLINR